MRILKRKANEYKSRIYNVDIYRVKLISIRAQYYNQLVVESESFPGYLKINLKIKKFRYLQIMKVRCIGLLKMIEIPPHRFWQLFEPHYYYDYHKITSPLLRNIQSIFINGTIKYG